MPGVAERDVAEPDALVQPVGGRDRAAGGPRRGAEIAQPYPAPDDVEALHEPPERADEPADDAVDLCAEGDDERDVARRLLTVDGPQADEGQGGRIASGEDEPPQPAQHGGAPPGPVVVAGQSLPQLVLAAHDLAAGAEDPQLLAGRSRRGQLEQVGSRPERLGGALPGAPPAALGSRLEEERRHAEQRQRQQQRVDAGEEDGRPDDRYRGPHHVADGVDAVRELLAALTEPGELVDVVGTLVMIEAVDAAGQPDEVLVDRQLGRFDEPESHDEARHVGPEGQERGHAEESDPADEEVPVRRGDRVGGDLHRVGADHAAQAFDGGECGDDDGPHRVGPERRRQQQPERAQPPSVGAEDALVELLLLRPLPVPRPAHARSAASAATIAAPSTGSPSVAPGSSRKRAAWRWNIDA